SPPMPRNTSPSHPTGEAPMSIVERARVALRNWINKPTRAEQLYREQSRENMVREQLEGIARQFESEALSWHAKGEREYRNWLDAQRAWIERLEAEASARGPEVCGELDI